MRLIRAVGAALALAALLVGVPWFLLQVGDPGHLLRVDWATALLAPMDSRLVLAVLSTVGWAAWLVIALTVVLEAVALLTRQRLAVHLPGTAWMRPMVGALLAALVAAPSLAAAAPPPPDRHEVAAPAGAATPQDSAQAPARTMAAPRVDRYLVRTGDELWTIAERTLGEGRRWREIAGLNPGIDETTVLQPGTTILLPRRTPPTRTVTVAEGDSLWSIAERELGDGERWPEIHRLNAAAVSDPDVIDVGWVLELPSPPPDEDKAAAGAEPAGSGAEEVSGATAEADSGPEPVRPVVRPTAGPDAVASTATPAASPVPSTVSAPGPAAASVSADDTEEPGPALLGPIGALTAAGVVAGLAARRRVQLAGRAIGRRLVPGSRELARFWAALAERADPEAAPPPDTGPTAIILGWGREGSPEMLDLEREGATVLEGPAAEPALAAAITGLACAPWSETVGLVVVGAPEWSDALDDPRIVAAPTAEAGIAELTRLCSTRRLALGHSSLAKVRADPETAVAWTPTVVVFAAPLSPPQLDAVADALALGEVGVSVLTVGSTPHIRAAVVRLRPERGEWNGRVFAPQLVDRPARRALLELFALTGTSATEPAPWWDADPATNVHPLPLKPESEEALEMTAPPSLPTHPTLRLLGDVSLDGAAGPRPSRAVGQCLEYCAWLLEHPSSTPSAMTRALLIAEPTRRSNVSRLRTWLGTAPDGAGYLPDAYSGRVMLDDRVTSDWERFRTLLGAGVDLAPDSALVEALRLVGGEPLGSFAFQWMWAHQLRADMVSMIADAACCLADRALERDDTALAQWAVGRGRLAAPDSDEVAAREILTHAAEGRFDDAERAALRLSRAARAQGRDLAPDLARRVQAALHGGTARRAAPLAD